jgi:hypothetical protein
MSCFITESNPEFKLFLRIFFEWKFHFLDKNIFPIISRWFQIFSLFQVWAAETFEWNIWRWRHGKQPIDKVTNEKNAQQIKWQRQNAEKKITNAKMPNEKMLESKTLKSHSLPNQA